MLPHRVSCVHAPCWERHFESSQALAGGCHRQRLLSSLALQLSLTPSLCWLRFFCQVYIFSRNCEDRTASFPDVVQAMLAAADPAQLPLVVDAELVAVDRANGNRVRAFQELATRPRPSAAAASGDHTGSAAAAAALAGAGPPPPAAAAAGTKRGKGSSAGPQRKQQKLSYSPAKQAASEDASEQLQTLAAADGGALQPQQAGGQQQIQQQAGGVDVCVFAFDALCVAGRDLMGLSLRQRRQALVGALRSITPGEVQMAEGVEVQLPLAAACGGTTAVAGHQAGEASAAAAATTGPVVAGPAAAGAAPAGRAGAGDPPASPPAGGTAHTGAGAVEGMSSAEDAATELFFSALAAGSEGLMMKLLDGPGRREGPRGWGRVLQGVGGVLRSASYKPLSSRFMGLCGVPVGFASACANWPAHGQHTAGHQSTEHPPPQKNTHLTHLAPSVCVCVGACAGRLCCCSRLCVPACQAWSVLGEAEA